MLFTCEFRPSSRTWAGIPACPLSSHSCIGNWNGQADLLSRAGACARSFERLLLELAIPLCADARGALSFALTPLEWTTHLNKALDTLFDSKKGRQARANTSFFRDGITDVLAHEVVLRLPIDNWAIRHTPTESDALAMSLTIISPGSRAWKEDYDRTVLGLWAPVSPRAFGVRDDDSR